LRRSPGKQLRAAVDHPVEHADLAIAIERGDEQLATVSDSAHLGIQEGRSVKVARLALAGESGSARRDPEERELVLGLATISASASREIECAVGIEGEGGDGGNSARATTLARIESFTRDVDAHAEAPGYLDFGVGDAGREHEGRGD